MTPAARTQAPVVCCDLDGVLWRGDVAIAGSADAVGALRTAGLHVAFVSNNASQPVADVVAKLARTGIDAAADDVITSAHAVAALLARDLASGARVLTSAGAGVAEALEDVGLRPVREPPADAVVVGVHPDFDYDELARVSQAVREGARFVATNLDATYPAPGGLLPGSGAIAAAVATASGRSPEVAGKPEPPMVLLVRERWGDRGVVVGDRPSSDGALAAALDWPFALVLSGVTAAIAVPGGEPIPDPAPPVVADDLAAAVPSIIDILAEGPAA